MTNETKWSLDLAHSDISFKVRHLMISRVKGSFKNFDVNIYTTGRDFTTANIDVWIEVASVTTNDATRDAHLKGQEFFDSDNHKQITFTANSIGKMDPDGVHELWGELTMKGFTKVIMLEVQFGGIANDAWGNEKAGFTVSGKINRNDWGLNWNAALETGGFLVSEEVMISCDLQLIKSTQKNLVMELENSETITN